MISAMFSGLNTEMTVRALEGITELEHSYKSCSSISGYKDVRTEVWAGARLVWSCIVINGGKNHCLPSEFHIRKGII